jgi:hypothetical protein
MMILVAYTTVKIHSTMTMTITTTTQRQKVLNSKSGGREEDEREKLVGFFFVSLLWICCVHFIELQTNNVSRCEESSPSARSKKVRPKSEQIQDSQNSKWSF